MGRTALHTYFADGLPNTTTRERSGPDLVVEQRSYDPAGYPTTTTTAGGITTTYTYDAAGNVSTRTLDPNGLDRQTTYRYAGGTVAYATTTGAASPNRTERVDYTYDAAGRLLTTTVDNAGGSPAELTTTLVRDPRGLVTRSIDASGASTDYTFDATGAQVSTTETPRTVWVNGVESTDVAPVSLLGRNTFGEVTQQRDANGNTTTTDYDRMGRPTRVTQPAYTPPGGTTITASTATHYNAQGLPAVITDPLGDETRLDYDKYGWLTTRTEQAARKPSGSKRGTSLSLILEKDRRRRVPR